MKTIKILGTGCPNCKTTEKVIKEAVKALGVAVTIEKVEDIMDIMKYDVMSTPAVVLDEKVMIKGRVPSVDEIKALLQDDSACCAPVSETTSSCCEPKVEESSSCCDSTPAKDADSSSCCTPKDDSASSCC